MGVCSSSNLTPAEKSANKAVNDMLKESHKKESERIKLLLLGAGESGKSTLLKQMTLMYGKGFNDDDRKGFISVIQSNLGASMGVLVGQAVQRGNESAVNAVCPNAEDTFASLNKRLERGLVGDSLGAEEFGLVKALWALPCIQEAYQARHEFTLIDSTRYFLDKIDEVTAPAYLPSLDDILRARVRTSGIIENTFLIDSHEFTVIDVGGQRSERRKWSACFMDVTAIIFVGVLSEYDQIMFEDENTNRMVESLNLWEEITNSRWFKDTRFILFLNKKDMFEEKIKTKPLTAHPLFADMDNSINSYDGGVEAIREMYMLGPSAQQAEKGIFVHITCATDRSTMSVVMAMVKDTVVDAALMEAGLLV